jgi:hypothetical protein
MSKVPLVSGPQGLRRLRRRLEHGEGSEPIRDHDLPRSDSARIFWSERAWSEYAAIPALSQLSLGLVREGGSIDALAAIGRMIHDEVRHTELARELADSFGGYEEEIPRDLPYQPAVLAEIEGQSAVSWLLSIVISESISAALLQARHASAKHPRVREVLELVLRDERAHAATGWVLARELIPTLEESARTELAFHALEIFESIGSTFATAGLPSLTRARERRIREDTASLGLGSLAPDDEDALVARVIGEVVAPRLAQVGVHVFAG